MNGRWYSRNILSAPCARGISITGTIRDFEPRVVVGALSQHCAHNGVQELLYKIFTSCSIAKIAYPFSFIFLFFPIIPFDELKNQRTLKALHHIGKSPRIFRFVITAKKKNDPHDVTIS